ncbi:MAG: B12-binding domain-containing radical SAM protein [Deltaproteobacteria bacterium]|nr:B12-binding domain-containing radical SAM protein [Deltaproteobacteria bacterium]
MNMQCDVVLLRPNDKKAVYNGVTPGATASDPPYWLALMGGWLRDKGIRVRLIDAEADNISPEETAAQLREINPRLIGILTLGSNLTASTWKMNGASLLARAIKDVLPDRPLFMWGYHVSALPERTLKEEACDFVIAGEGFATILELTESILTEKRQYSLIKGLWYKIDDKIGGNNAMQLIRDLDELPYDGWDMLPVRSYRNHMHFAFEDLSKRDRYGAIMTSLGCPYNCSYCAISYFSGDKVMRYKSPEKCMEEIDYWVAKQGVYYLRILDECFTVNRKHVFDFCNLLIERGHKLSIWINARTDLVDQEMLEIMSKAGIRWIGYGFESGNIRIRNTVQKGQYDLDKIKNVVKMTHDAGISICSNFMFGLPGDTVETMQDTLALARELCCEHPNLYCTMAYPGSKLYREALAQGWELPDSWLGYAQLSYETHPLPTEFLSSAEVLAFRDFAFQEFYRNNPHYFQNIRNKFGDQAIAAIEGMLQGKIPRKLLGD